jgi:hypothetical protein
MTLLYTLSDPKREGQQVAKLLAALFDLPIGAVCESTKQEDL